MQPVKAVKTTKGPAVVQRVLVDEELWFGTANPGDAEKAAANSMAATAGTVLGTKPFPESARRLAELSSDDHGHVNEMVQVLEQDPALSAKLLRVVNSAGFGLRNRCTSVRHAVTLVGSKHLHQMATTAAVLDLFDADNGPAVVVMEHSAMVGAFCRYLGAHQGLPAEDLFTIGVLHDIGKVMLLESFGDSYHAMFDQCLSQPDGLFALERAAYGFDHGVLAAHVLKAWNIPQPIPKVVAWHHEPTRAYDSSPAVASLVHLLRLADLLVLSMTNGATRADLNTIAQHEAASYLDISAAQLDAMWDELVSLRERTLHQKRGGEEETDGENESVARVKAAPQPHPSADLPRQFRCAECGSPSFGTACPACQGYTCPNHPVGERGWCRLCDAEYPAFAISIGPKVTWIRGSVTAIALAAIGSASGWFLGAADGLLRGCAAGLALSGLGLGVAFLVRRTRSRSRFVRTRPHRSEAEKTAVLPADLAG